MWYFSHPHSSVPFYSDNSVFAKILCPDRVLEFSLRSNFSKTKERSKKNSDRDKFDLSEYYLNFIPTVFKQGTNTVKTRNRCGNGIITVILVVLKISINLFISSFIFLFFKR